MTQDHLFLVVGTYGRYVYIYKHNGTQFHNSQNLYYSGGYDHKFVSITDDHKFLTVSDWRYDDIYRY